MLVGSLYRALLLFVLGAAACQDGISPVEPAAFAKGGGRPSPVPTGKGIGTLTDSAGPRTSNRVEYHNGAVMLGTVRVYLIWYGDWVGDPDDSTGPEEVLTDFVLSLSGTPYFRIHTLYTDGTGARSSGNLSWGRNINDDYSRGSTLSEADIGGVVAGAILSGQLPLDPNGIYVVVGSPDVSVGSGLGDTYCAVHPKRVMVSGVPIANAFVGSPARNPAKCASQLFGPNGDWVGDAMAAILATVLSNAILDPDHTGWYDRLGLEPGDKCAWNFGPVYQAANGALANISLGGRDYLLPKLWVPGKANSGYCALAVPGS